VGSYCKVPCDALFILRNTNNPQEVLKSGLGLGTGDVLPRLIKDYTECRLADRGPFNWSHASSWVTFASGRLIPE
jgi:hypothetical protein